MWRDVEKPIDRLTDTQRCEKKHLEYFGLEITGLSSKTQTYMDDIGNGEQLQNSAFTQRLGCSTELEHGLKVCHPVN
jgi:hypothetical protein